MLACLWATVRHVACANSVRIVCCICASVGQECSDVQNMVLCMVLDDEI